MEERSHKLKVKLTAITKVGDDIYSFTFHPLGNVKLPTFTSGSHIDLHINAELIRQYSLCNNSLETEFYQITVQIEANGKGGSKTLYQDAKINQIYEISAPRNHFPLNLGAKKHLLIAGGIGITPLLAMASDLKKRAPPWSWIIFLVTYNPKPIPSPSDFVVKNGVNTFSCSSAGIPIPESVILTKIQPPGGSF